MKKILLTMFFVMLIMLCFGGYVSAATCPGCGNSCTITTTYYSSSQHKIKYNCNPNTGCGGGTDYANHSYGSWKNKGSTHERDCSGCGYTQSRSHSYGAWYKVDNSSHRRDCASCSAYETGSHSATSAATCTTASYCGACQALIADALGHSYPATYETTKTQHWQFCARGCDVLVYGYEDHYDLNKNGYCDICNYLMDITPPVISFSPISNSTKAKAHSTIVTVTDEGGSGLDTCKYIWNTSSTAPTEASKFTTTFTAGATINTPVVTGTYYLHVYAVDGSGNYTIKSSGGFVLDNTAPTGTVKINNGALYTDTAAVNLNFTASSDTAQMAISNTTTKPAYETYSTTKSWNLDSAEGTKTVYVWFKDDVGNESGMYSATIILDLTNPELGTLTLEPTTHTITATVTGAKDSASGIKNYDYYLDGTLKGSGKPATYVYTGLTPNTRYNSTYLVRDNVNKTSPISSAKYKYTLAMIPKDVVASNGTSDTSITVSWNANENPAGTTYVIDYTEDGKNWTNLATITTTSYTHSGLAKNKVYQYRVKAINGENISTNYSGAATGKTTPTVASDSIILDLEAPVASFVFNRDEKNIERSITVNIQETYEINVLKYVWKTTNTKLTAESQFTDGTFLSGNAIIPPSTLASGNYYLHVYASDKAGNSGFYVSSVYRNIPEIDVTKCGVVINKDAPYTNSTSVVLTTTANSAAYMYFSETAVAVNSIADSSWKTFAATSNFTLSSTNGEKTVYAYYKDIFGNAVSVSDTINLDTVKPGIGDMTGEQFKNTASGGTVSVSASGFTDYDGAGVDTCEWTYKIDNGSWSTAVVGTISNSASTYNVPITDAGVYTVRVTVYDKSGYDTSANYSYKNSNSSYKETTIILDRTPPTIGTITAAQTLNSANGAKVTIEASQFTDAGGSGVDYGTWQHKFGTGSFSSAVTATIIEDVSDYDITIGNDGTYTIRMTLYDKAGNSSYKETTVQIDHTAPTLGTLGLTATTSSITATVTGASDNVQVGGYEFYIDGIFASKQESNVYTFEGLTCSTPYDITYKVFDIFGNYTDMSPISVKYTLANVPIDLAASDEWSPTKIAIEWGNNGNAPEVIYELVVSDDNTTWSAPIYTGTECEFIHENLPIATTKYYKVRAKNQEGIYTEYSNVDSGQTISDIVPPTAYINARENITVGIEHLAKETDDVRIIITVNDDAFASSSLVAEDLRIFINGVEISPTRKEIESVTEIKDGLEISLLLKGVEKDGPLVVRIPDGKFLDTTGNRNEELYLISGMDADNTDPGLTVNAFPVDETYDGYYIDISATDLNGIRRVTVNGEEITLDENGYFRYYTENNDTYEIIAEDTVINTSTESRVIDLIELGKNFEATWLIPVDTDGSGQGTTVTLPIPAIGSNNYLVVWGDGTHNRYTRENLPTHTYTNTEETEYMIKVKGKVDTLGYTNTVAPTETNTYSDYYTFTEYLTKIVEWGDLGAKRFGFAHCTDLAGPIPAATGFKNLTSVENMFLNCTSLNESIPENFLDEATEIKNAKGMFMNCEQLTGEIPEGLFVNNSKITTFENTFNNCAELIGEIPATLFENATEVTSYAGTFNGCAKLTGVIPETLFANSLKVNTFKETFANCSGLVSPAANDEGIVTVVPEDLFVSNRYVLNYYRTFYNCTGLTGKVTKNIFSNNIVIDEIPEDTTVNSNYRATFEGCTGIEDVDLNLYIIGHEMFKNCTSITQAKMSKAIDIGNEAFYGCNALNNIQVFDGYLRTIGTDAFEYTGTNPDKLVTYINDECDVLTDYVWIDDNRIVDTEAPKGTVEIVTERYPFTKEQKVKLTITLSDNYSTPENCEMSIINEDIYAGLTSLDELTWQAYTSDVEWTLTPNDDIKTVWVFFRDEFGNVSKLQKEINM